jgi:hypothetical protein
MKFTYQVTVTVPPGGSEDAGDYAVDMAEATSALGFDVSAFELVVTEAGIASISRMDALRQSAREAWAAGKISGADLQDRLSRISFMERHERGSTS